MHDSSSVLHERIIFNYSFSRYDLFVLKKQKIKHVKGDFTLNKKTALFSSLALSGLLFSTVGATSASAMANDGGHSQTSQSHYTPTQKTSASNTYVVKQGDTLSRIASAHGTSYVKLMQLNGLSSTTIYAGQSLKVTGTVTKTVAVTKTPTQKRVTQTSNTVTQVANTAPAASSSMATAASVALSVVGTPYKWGGKAPGGFDCSGLIYYATQKAGANLGYATAAGLYAGGTSVSTPQVGDLVFFSNTYKAGISHVGIYIGNGQMVSAASDGVQVDAVQGAYWKDHFTGYKRY